jgi:hypothetical protein
MKTRFKTNLGMAILMLVVYGLPVAALLFLAAQRAQAALPPRPTPISRAAPRPAPPTGGRIALRAPSARGEMWTMVQWQDAFGGWHDVEGWQGTFDDIKDGVGEKLWWVAEENLSTGPFRWAVYEDKGGQFLAASEPFYLPDAVGATVQVDVSLEP